MRGFVRLPLLFGAALVAAGAARTAAAQQAPVVECARCHANRDFLMNKAASAHQDSALFVPAAVLQGTVHQTLRCTDCHRGFESGYPHRFSAIVVPCETCHQQEGTDWTASIHAANAATKGDAPTCVGCHGAHVVYGVKDVRSPVYPLNVAAMCGRCHGDARIIGTYFATPEKIQGRIATTQFPKSVHGVALTRDGLIVSATCSNCHRAHRVLPADSAGSSVNIGEHPRDLRHVPRGDRRRRTILRHTDRCTPPNTGRPPRASDARCASIATRRTPSSAPISRSGCSAWCGNAAAVTSGCTRRTSRPITAR